MPLSRKPAPILMLPDYTNAAKAHRHLHYPSLALLKPETGKKKKKIDGSLFFQSPFLMRTFLWETDSKMEFNVQEIYWGRHFWSTKGAGAGVDGGKPSEHEEVLTPVQEEKKRRKVEEEEPQTSAQFWKHLRQTWNP